MPYSYATAYTPQTPSPHYDGCNSALSICHTLDCNKDGLITASHNDLRDGFANILGKHFTPSHMHYNPLIHPGCAVRKVKDHTNG